MYGGVYEFGENGVVTVTHPGREFTGKWWPVNSSAIKFQLYDEKGRLRGVNSLEMRTETTATVHLAGATRSYRWNQIAGRGSSSNAPDLASAGWFMEALRF
jgi:hypothetical protein